MNHIFFFLSVISLEFFVFPFFFLVLVFIKLAVSSINGKEIISAL